MSTSPKKSPQYYWFKRRRYGYGWIPVTLEGWVVLLVYLVAIFLATLLLLGDDPTGFTAEVAVFFVVFFLLTVGLVYIAAKKGPKPKWRWGKSDDDNPKEDF